MTHFWRENFKTLLLIVAHNTYHRPTQTNQRKNDVYSVCTTTVVVAVQRSISSPPQVLAAATPPVMQSIKNQNIPPIYPGHQSIEETSGISAECFDHRTKSPVISYPTEKHWGHQCWYVYEPDIRISHVFLLNQMEEYNLPRMGICIRILVICSVLPTSYTYLPCIEHPLR